MRVMVRVFILTVVGEASKISTVRKVVNAEASKRKQMMRLSGRVDPL